ncbi:hypothetical protein F4806DRAFT_172215 [Annulohypoxylon nitens]|nr:hypothetical protein F4806DRAFT_172215 [Annulohypoxylon nitens]
MGKSDNAYDFNAYEKDVPPPYSFAGSDIQFQQPPPPPPASSSQYQYFPPPPPQPQPQMMLQQTPRIPRQFPNSFNMYRGSGIGNRHFTLGEHQNAPLYAVALHSGFSGKPSVVLHNGPSDNRPPLAAVEKSGWSSKGTVYLPPPPVMGAGANAGVRGSRGGKEGAAEERFEAGGGFGHKIYTFSIETGVGAGARREMFEWRHSSGRAVKGLDGRSGGWKLCRLATGPPAGAEGRGFVEGGERGSDGREIVAVWAWASGSLTKLFKFSFLGSGANGVLGERWAVMAVMTALKMWDIERRARQAAANAAGGGA